MNGEVTVAFVAVGAALVLLIAFRFVWRRVVDERRSVQDYQHTLDTLRVVAGRNEPQRVRPVAVPPGVGMGGPGAAQQRRTEVREPGAGPERVAAAATMASDEPTRMLARVRVPGEDPGDGGPDGESPPGLDVDSTSTSILIFDDVAASPASAPAAAPAARGVMARSAAAGEPAVQWNAAQRATTTTSGAPTGATERRTWSGQGPGRAMKIVTVAAAVLLAAAIATMIAALARPGHRVATGATFVGGASGSPGGQPTGGSGGSGVARSSGTRAGSTGRSPAPTTVQPTSATLYAATVTAPAAGYTVAVSVTGNCWIEGQRTDTGQDVWSGTLTAGQQHRFSFAGPVVLRIGAANAAVSMNGEPVALPSGYQAPYNVTFQPA